jgi:protein associated with RNAse G/E
MSGINESITVLKLNLTGDITWQYEGRVLKHDSNYVVLEAFFNRPDTPFLDLILKEKDRYVETFYTDRWYNIFEIYDRDDGKLKGWYCNIALPAAISEGKVSYIDLDLDLWVSVDGKQTVLDEDEFLALNLEVETREKALLALTQLKREFETRRPPI